ncbi:hypothetical protein RUM43_001167 [Polyplax serrata]|uniref:Uncharacterized protein n=1 Tax=Polyplax serrata TaxID=468196 RepID=A0AAN8XRM6_POLSC
MMNIETVYFDERKNFKSPHKEDSNESNDKFLFFICLFISTRAVLAGTVLCTQCCSAVGALSALGEIIPEDGGREGLTRRELRETGEKIMERKRMETELDHGRRIFMVKLATSGVSLDVWVGGFTARDLNLKMGEDFCWGRVLRNAKGPERL